MDDPWISHRIVYRIIDLDVIYKALSPLRIGSGKSIKLESPVDLPVIRINLHGSSIPYIPGSSIKGVFRSTAEYIAKSVGIRACSRGDGCKQQYNKELQGRLREGDIEGVFGLLKDKYCLICKIFGSGTYRSHIDFKDAYPEGGVTTGVKTGIAIDRRSGTVKRGALFTVEYVDPGAYFKGGITLLNVPNYGVGLIKSVIDLINAGIVRLGGMRSRGFGRIGIEVSKITVYTMKNGIIKEVREKTYLNALDEFDEDIEFDPSKPLEYLDSCMEVWSRYVSKTGD